MTEDVFDELCPSAFEIAGDQITSIGSINNPNKLAHLGPVGDLGSLLRSAR